MKLKEARSARGLTQKAVADYLGCSTVVYSRYGTGNREPSIETLIKMADCFETTVDYLIGRKGTKTQVLSSYEAELLNAARNADERARQDTLSMLETHSVSDKKENLA